MRAILSVVAVILVACGSTEAGETQPSAATLAYATGSPGRACADYADEAAALAARCGLDAADYRARAVTQLACGSCDNALAIRDEAALRGACFAFLRSATCEQLRGEAPYVEPAGCRWQILQDTTCSRREADAADQACLDFVGAAEAAYQRCGHAPGEASSALLTGIGSCDRFTAVNDADVFPHDCIDALTYLDCSLVNDMTHGTLPSSCKGQLVSFPAPAR